MLNLKIDIVDIQVNVGKVRYTNRAYNTITGIRDYLTSRSRKSEQYDDSVATQVCGVNSLARFGLYDIQPAFVGPSDDMVPVRGENCNTGILLGVLSCLFLTQLLRIDSGSFRRGGQSSLDRANC